MNTPSLSKRKNLRSRGSSENQRDEAKNGNINNGSAEPMSADRGNLDSSRKNSYRSASRKRKKVYKKKKVYPLRSSTDGARILRSRSNSKSSASNESASAPVVLVPKVRRKRKHMKKASDDELSRTRKRVRYLLARMQYEQSLLDAYSGEGWKGQSSEKIRPEKELDRAKSEILRCKLKIRDLFQHLDSLGMEGRLDESLFDAEGEISSEDILCANCSSKELSADNDIILCDGSCDRGFHQKCLNPPLLSEDIPPGDEGWLCPVCDCKADCINFLNEIEGLDLSVEDAWEEVFPEAAAIANGDRKYDDLGLPSDDSEDDDFNPDAPDIDVENGKEGSSSGESSSGESYYTCSSEHSDIEASNPDKHSNTLGLPSDDSDDDDDDYDPDGPDPEKIVQKDDSSLEGSDFTSDSDDFMEEIRKADHLDAGALNHDNHSNTLGLPSDDSDDDDYDPDDPDPEKSVQMDGSSLEGSDFTSDSDDFMEEITKASDANGASSSLKRKPLDLSGEHINSNVIKKSLKNPELRSILEPDMNGESVQLVSGKRQRENLDYKKLYDEEYGDASSDSSDEDDGDWSGKSSVKKAKKVETKEGSSVLLKANTTMASKGKPVEVNSTAGVHFDQSPVPRIVNSRRKTPKKLELSAASLSSTVKSCDSLELDSSRNKGSACEKLGTMATQRLLEAFVDNQYPDRKTRESLAKETGKTVKQVTKWFGNARHSTRVVAQESGQAGSATPTKSVGTSKTVTGSAKSSVEAGRAGFSTPTESTGTSKTDTDSGKISSRTRRCGEALNHTGSLKSGASNGKKAKAPPVDRPQKATGQVGRKRKKSR